MVLAVTSTRALIACGALLGVIAIAFTAGAAPEPSKATPASKNSRGVAALGRIEPLNGIITVSASSTPDATSGAVLTKLYVERGSDVTAGQLLAEVDTAGIARARVIEAKAALETARRDATASVSVADEACVHADVAAKRAKRKQDLLARGLASTEETDLAKGDADATVASCKARRASATVAQSRVTGAAASLARYEAELERSLVRSPYAGRIIDVLRRPGEIVGQVGIVELARVDQMQAIAEVFESDIRFVKPGQRAKVRSKALGQELTGTVTRIRPKVQKLDQIGDDPIARKDGRIVEVEIKLDDGRPVANLTNLQVEVEIGR